jgi:hypothetical protein
MKAQCTEEYCFLATVITTNEPYAPKGIIAEQYMPLVMIGITE